MRTVLAAIDWVGVHWGSISLCLGILVAGWKAVPEPTRRAFELRHPRLANVFRVLAAIGIDVVKAIAAARGAALAQPKPRDPAGVPAPQPSAPTPVTIPAPPMPLPDNEVTPTRPTSRRLPAADPRREGGS